MLTGDTARLLLLVLWYRLQSSKNGSKPSKLVGKSELRKNTRTLAKSIRSQTGGSAYR